MTGKFHFDLNVLHSNEFAMKAYKMAMEGGIDCYICNEQVTQ